MNIGEVLSQAGKIIWKHKVLWIFGIFVSCSANGGNIGNSARSTHPNEVLPPRADQILNSVDTWVWVSIGLFLVAVVVIVILLTIALGAFGRIALVQGTVMADDDEDAAITFSGLFRSSKPFFWRILGLNLLVMLTVFLAVAALIFFTAIASVVTLGLALLCLLPLLCVLAPATWFLMTFVEMANVAIVLDDLSITEGIQRGWTVFRENLGDMLIMGLVLAFGGMFVGVALALPMMLAMAPLMFGLLASTSGGADNLSAVSVVLAGLCMVAYLPVLIVGSGIVRAYIAAAWTLTYLRLTEGGWDTEGRQAILEPEPPAGLDPEPEPESADGTLQAENQPETAAHPKPEPSPAPEDDDEIPADF